MTSIASNSIREQVLSNINDRELTKSEYNSLKSHFLKQNPALKEEDFDKELANTLSGLNDKNSVSELSKKIKDLSSSTEMSQVSLFFDKSFQARIKNDDVKINVNLDIEDADGISSNSKNDLAGEVSGNVKINLDKDGLINKNLNKYFMKLEPQKLSDGKTKYDLNVASVKVGSISVENGKMNVSLSKVSNTLLNLTDKVGYKDEALNYFSKAFKEATGITLKPQEIKDGNKSKFVLDVEQFTLRGNIDNGSFDVPNSNNIDNLPSEIRVKPSKDSFSFDLDDKGQLKVSFEKVKLEGDSDTRGKVSSNNDGLNREKLKGDLTIRLNSDDKSIKPETIKFNNFKAEFAVNEKLLKSVSDTLKKGDKVLEKQLQAIGIPNDIINKIKILSSNDAVKELLHNQGFMDKLKSIKLNVDAESLVIDSNDTNIVAKANNLKVSSDIKGEAFIDKKPETKNKQSEIKVDANIKEASFSKSVLSVENFKNTQDTLNSDNKDLKSKLVDHLKKNSFSQQEIDTLKGSSKKDLENLVTSSNISDILKTDDKFKAYLNDKGMEFLSNTLKERVENKFSFLYGEKTKPSQLAKQTQDELFKSGLSKEQIDFIKNNPKDIVNNAKFAGKINDATSSWSTELKDANVKVSMASENKTFAEAKFQAKNLKASQKLSDKELSATDVKASGQFELDHAQLKRLGNSLSELGKDVLNHIEKLGLKEENFKAIIDKINLFSQKGSDIKDTATKISKDLKIPESEVKDVMSLLENKDFQALMDNIENTRKIIDNAKSTGKISAEFSSSLIDSKIKDTSLISSTKNAMLKLNTAISSPKGKSKGDLQVNWNNISYTENKNNKELKVSSSSAKAQVVSQDSTKNETTTNITSKTQGSTFTKKGDVYNHTIKETSFDTSFNSKNAKANIKASFDSVNSKGVDNRKDLNSSIVINSMKADSTAYAGNRSSKIDINTEKIVFSPESVDFGKTKSNIDMDRSQGNSSLKAKLNIQSEGMVTSEKKAELRPTSANVNANFTSTTTGDIKFKTKADWDGKDSNFSDLNTNIQGLNMETFTSAIKLNPNGKKLLEKLSEQGININGKKVNLDVSNATLDSNKVSGKITLENMKTNLGEAEISLNLKDIALEGKQTSDVKGSINMKLDEKELTKFINGKIKELQKAGKLPESFKIDAKFSEGKVTTTADTWYAGAEAGITVKNNKITIDIEKAKLIGIFSVRSLSADFARDALAKEGIEVSKDKRTLTLDVKQIFSKYINDKTDLSNTTIRGNNLSFDFKYKD